VSKTGLRLDGLTPICGEVVPHEIVALDKCDPPGTVQSLDLFLSADRVADVLVLFEVNQAVDFVSLGESSISPRLCWATRRSMLLVTPV
jgi:hypothetical protein